MTEYNSPNDSNQDPSEQRDSNTYVEVDEIKRWQPNRVTSSAELLINTERGSFGSHGPLDRHIKIPYKNGNPIQVTLPRLRLKPRVLVCRDQDIIRKNGRAVSVKSPELRTGDIVAIRTPLVFNTKDMKKEVSTQELDGIPTPLFRNAKTLKLSDDLNFYPGWQYALEIESIDNGIAFGIKYNQSEWRTRKSTSESLRKVSEDMEMITETARSRSTDILTTGWDDRKRELLNDLASTYD
jgi:hypothetical protein